MSSFNEHGSAHVGNFKMYTHNLIQNLSICQKHSLAPIERAFMFY